MVLQLTRPLIIFDLETTGVDPREDRIVEIAALRIEPDGGREMRSERMNPQRPIPAGATAVHGISDADVADAPTFRQAAAAWLEYFEGADVGGFNVVRFDVPLLDREFRDLGLDFAVADRRVVDSMRIFHQKERRDLTAAARFYLDSDHAGAHAADADVEMTAKILEAQLQRYEDLPRDVAALAEFCDPPRPGGIDRQGKFLWQNGEAVIGFGKHQGHTLRELAARNPGYLKWILKTDFPEDAKTIASNALAGTFPEPEKAGQST